ncbi:MAG: molybdopterin cofactor-binding domain-containing protein [Terriglobia bacterium]
MEARVVTEVERYEITGELHPGFSRRQVFQLLGGGIAVFLLLKGDAAAAQHAHRHGRMMEEKLPRNIGAWLHIDPSGTVTVYTGKAEMGQNIRTSLSQGVAEELRVPLASVRLVMADTERTPFDLGTFGSRTTPTMNLQLRRVASAARDLLVDLAAKEWNVAPGSLRAEDGVVRDPATGRQASYATLAAGRELASAVVEDDDPLRPAAEWTVAGHSAPKINGVEFVTGAHRFSPDVSRPRMLSGKVLRPPSFGATLVSLDSQQAQRMTGVTVFREGDFVGVAAPSEQTAVKALAALRAGWKEKTGQVSGADLYTYLKEDGAQRRESSNRAGRETGSNESALPTNAQRLKQTYTVAYIAHAPLEPRAAVAEWADGKVTVWTGTQRPFAVRDQVAQACGAPSSQVRVIVPDTGGAFGGKHTGEVAVEAALLARAAGKPVKRVWTREEEFTWAYFRPAGVIEVASAVSADGALLAWEFDNYNSGEAGIQTPYAAASQRIEFHPCDAPLRQGSYRCLAASANHFARESHMEDLARLLRADSVKFRLKNLPDERVRTVLATAADRFGWNNRKRASGQGAGIACGVEKGGHVATCAEVRVDPATSAVHVLRIVTAFDCGAVVNPDGLKNQIAGAAVMGLGGALFEAIEFENGRILDDRFSRYRVPRFSDLPEIEVALVDRKDQPSAGAGEAPIMCIAPAIRNAILDATGVQLFTMPLAPRGVRPRAA